MCGVTMPSGLIALVSLYPRSSTTIISMLGTIKTSSLAGLTHSTTTFLMPAIHENKSISNRVDPRRSLPSRFDDGANDMMTLKENGCNAILPLWQKHRQSPCLPSNKAFVQSGSLSAGCTKGAGGASVDVCGRQRHKSPFKFRPSEVEFSL